MCIVLDIQQRNEIQHYLDQGMTPDDIAATIGRIAGLNYLDMVVIKSAAYDLINGAYDQEPPAEIRRGPARLTLVHSACA